MVAVLCDRPLNLEVVGPLVDSGSTMSQVSHRRAWHSPSRPRPCADCFDALRAYSIRALHLDCTQLSPLLSFSCTVRHVGYTLPAPRYVERSREAGKTKQAFEDICQYPPLLCPLVAHADQVPRSLLLLSPLSQ